MIGWMKSLETDQWAFHGDARDFCEEDFRVIKNEIGNKNQKTAEIALSYYSFLLESIMIRRTEVSKIWGKPLLGLQLYISKDKTVRFGDDNDGKRYRAMSSERLQTV